MLDNTSSTSYIPEALQKEIDTARRHLDTLKSEEISMRGIIVSIEHETIAKEKYLEDLKGRCDLFDERVASAKVVLENTEQAIKEANENFAKENDEMTIKRAELSKRETATEKKESELNERNEQLLASMLETAKAKKEAEEIKQLYTEKIAKIREIIV